MALNDISLTSSMRSNLISLQTTSTLLSRTQDRLSTGKKVNSALDNPTNFFAAQSHTQRAADLSVRKDGMTEAVQGVQAANKGITGITALIEAAKGLTQAARSADTTNRDALAQQFNTVLDQISALASDSGYKGKNFLTNDSLQVLFNENGLSALTISGFNATATTGMGISGVQAAVSGVASGSVAGTSGTMAVIAGASGTNSGTITLSGTSINIAVHAGALDTSVPGYVLPSGVLFASANATITSNQVSGGASGGTIILTATGMNFTGMGALETGVLTLTAVYISGVEYSGFATGFQLGDSGAVAGTYTGVSSGVFYVRMYSGTTVTSLLHTGTSISFEFSVAKHGASGTGLQSATNMTVFNLATGDVGTGLSLLDTNTAASGTGMLIYVSGSAVATGSAWLSGNNGAGGTSGNNQIVFTGLAVPPQSGVTYTYNTGFVATSTTGARTMNELAYTGTALASGEYISEVRISGTVIDSGYYTIASNTVTFNAGAVLTGLLHSGDVVGITTTAKKLTFTVSGTLTADQYITTGSVTVSGAALDSGYYTIAGGVVTIKSGALSAGLAHSGSAVTYTVTTNAVAAIGGGWSGDAGIDNSVTQLNTAVDTLRTKSANLASNLSVVTIRQDFTDGMINTLLKGADNLTLADMNEEGANMLMLQTRQQLGTTSLKMASDAAQSVLRLF